MLIVVVVNELLSSLHPSIGFDHHCPYTSTCIGQRNRKHFLVFVLCSTLQLLIVLSACAMRLVDDMMRRYSILLLLITGGTPSNSSSSSSSSHHHDGGYSLLLQACVQSTLHHPLNSCCCVVLALLLVKLLPFCQVLTYLSIDALMLPIYLSIYVTYLSYTYLSVPPLYRRGGPDHIRTHQEDLSSSSPSTSSSSSSSSTSISGRRSGEGKGKGKYQ